MLLKTLPNGAGDLQSVELVRRPSSSVKSRSSTSAASVASTSAASASEDDLASIGRRKSVSRTSSLSRPSTAARDKKPHDLAHGHLADHPTHVSNAYSPYPHHHPHHHNHHMHVPSPLARSDGGSSGQRTGSNNSPVATNVPPVPPLPPQLSDRGPQQQQQHSPLRLAQSPGSSLPVVPKQEPLSNEALASAFFFRDFPPEARSSSHSPDTSQYGTPAPQGSSRVSSGNNSRERPAYPSPHDYTQAVKVETPAHHPAPNALYADPRTASFESLPGIDPAAAAYVLGTTSDAPRNGAAAPMYGEGDLYYPETGANIPADDSAYETFSLTTTNGYVDYRDAPQASSSASSDIYELPPTDPAVYGYPLESVSSNAPSSYSGYESAASATGGAASALERLDLDFDLPKRTSPMHTPSAHSGPSIARPPPPDRVYSSASSSAASAYPPLPGEGVDMQTTDLDGILEWLASSTAAGGLPPPPPSSRGEPARHDSASSSVATWPSAPPSSYGDSVIGAGYNAGAMYGGGGGGWTSYSESSDARPPAMSSSSAAGSSQAPAAVPNGGRTGGITWADNRDASDDDDSQAGEENSAGERVPRRRERNADLEMLRTATITYRDASFSASASDSPDVGGAGAAWDSTRANSPHDPAAASATGAARYARGHAFAAFIGDEFDRFGLGGEFDDDDWFRQIGVGSSGVAGLGDLRSGLAGLTAGGAEGDGGEDDGYEEDDEASVIGSRNPFDGNGFGDGYERSPDHMHELDGDGDDDELGWDRDQTFGAGPLPPEPPSHSSRFDPTQPAIATSSPDDPRDPDFRLESDDPPPPSVEPAVAQSIPLNDLRIDAEPSHATNADARDPVDVALEARSPASPSRLAAYLEQLEDSKSAEEAAHDRGAGMWW